MSAVTKLTGTRSGTVDECQPNGKSLGAQWNRVLPGAEARRIRSASTALGVTAGPG